MWLLKTYAIPAGMYASQICATPFLQQGKEMHDPIQKWPPAMSSAYGAQEDNDAQGHNPFMVRKARVWSIAFTV